VLLAQLVQLVAKVQLVQLVQQVWLDSREVQEQPEIKVSKDQLGQPVQQV
jgi:hypothetical protein